MIGKFIPFIHAAKLNIFMQKQIILVSFEKEVVILTK